MEKLRLIKVVWLLLGNNTEFSDENSELCNGEIIHLWLCVVSEFEECIHVAM